MIVLQTQAHFTDKARVSPFQPAFPHTKKGSPSFANEPLDSERRAGEFRFSHGEDITISSLGGTRYDLTNACPNCQTGAKQTSPAYLTEHDKKKIRKHRAILASYHSLIVDGGMRKKLVDAGVTGISFGDVRMRQENNKWSEVARDQVFATHTLPPMRGELTDLDEQYLCKTCKRGGRRRFSTNPYREEDLVGLQDFNLTWEWFGEFWPEDKEKTGRPNARTLISSLLPK